MAMSPFDAARRAYAVLEAADKADPDGKSGLKGQIQTAMAILIPMIPEHPDHYGAMCGGDTCVGCALDVMRRLAGVPIGKYDADGCAVDAVEP